MSSGDTFKVCLLGEGRVGKTSLVRRFTADDFSDKEHTTIQVPAAAGGGGVFAEMVVLWRRWWSYAGMVMALFRLIHK